MVAAPYWFHNRSLERAGQACAQVRSDRCAPATAQLCARACARRAQWVCRRAVSGTILAQDPRTPRYSYEIFSSRRRVSDNSSFRRRMPGTLSYRSHRISYPKYFSLHEIARGMGLGGSWIGTAEAILDENRSANTSDFFGLLLFVFLLTFGFFYTLVKGLRSLMLWSATYAGIKSHVGSSCIEVYCQWFTSRSEWSVIADFTRSSVILAGIEVKEVFLSSFDRAREMLVFGTIVEKGSSVWHEETSVSSTLCRSIDEIVLLSNIMHNKCIYIS